MNKPAWMPMELYWEFCERYKDEDGIIHCAHCGTDQDITVDHILPRYDGGTDAIDNLQPLCFDHNRRKGVRPDSYWRHNFYFDDGYNVAAFRTSQRQEAFEKILSYADWFTRPRSDIARQLYVLAWIVGAGKTLSIPAITYAYNFIVRRDVGLAASRADRILVLVKETAIRDQLAADLEADLTKYGIAGRAPRVLVIDNGSVWSQDQLLEEHDVVVACIHQVWKQDEKHPSHLKRTLARFPLIFFDEPHYALPQVMSIVNEATSSICFGLTGTPIDAKGDPLKRMALFSTYDYQSADVNDKSVKYLSDDPAEFETFVEELAIDEASVMDRGQQKQVFDEDDEQSYSKQIVPAKSVAERVIKHVKDCDDYLLLMSQPADHRLKIENVFPDLMYPVHAMITVDTIVIGEMLVEIINRIFEGNRKLYPLDKGFRASFVRSDVYEDGENGKTVSKGERLTPDHGWMKYKRTGVLNADCSRFLIVDGIGREGVNNPYCGVVGIARSTTSMIELVQRGIGRQIRSVTRELGNILHVPPDKLDMLRIITHRAFNNAPYIQQAIDFTMNMEMYFANMLTIDQLIAGDGINSNLEIGGGNVVTDRDRLRVVSDLGYAKLNDIPVSPDMIARDFKDASPEKQGKIAEWAQLVMDSPEEAGQVLGLNARLNPIAAVMRELISVENVSDQDLVYFIKRHYEDCIEYLEEFERNRKILRKLYAQYVEKFHLGDIPQVQEIDSIRRQIGNQIWQRLVESGCTRRDDGVFKSKVFSLTGSAVKQKLGVPNGESAGNESKWNVPQYHVLLTRPEIKRDITGWVRNQLIRSGHMPNMAAILNIEVEDESAIPQ